MIARRLRAGVNSVPPKEPPPAFSIVRGRLPQSFHSPQSKSLTRLILVFFLFRVSSSQRPCQLTWETIRHKFAFSFPLVFHSDYLRCWRAANSRAECAYIFGTFASARRTIITRYLKTEKEPSILILPLTIGGRNEAAQRRASAAGRQLHHAASCR